MKDLLLRYDNHPLRNAKTTCAKCKSPYVMAPSYPGDWFDCIKCGHSMKPTAKQSKLMHGVK